GAALTWGWGSRATAPLPRRSNRRLRRLPLTTQHLRPPLVLVDEARDELRPAGPTRHADQALLAELLEHAGAKRLQPILLRGDLPGQLGACGLTPGLLVRDVAEQALPAVKALLDSAGHAALLLNSLYYRTPQL